MSNQIMRRCSDQNQPNTTPSSNRSVFFYLITFFLLSSILNQVIAIASNPASNAFNTMSKESESSWSGIGPNDRWKNRLGTDIAISTVSVLLPHHMDVSYRIDAFNGCFEWSVTTSDVINIYPDPSECSTYVYIRPFAPLYKLPSSTAIPLTSSGTRPGLHSSFKKNEDRLRTWLLVTDKKSSRILRAEIFLDQIVKILILTTTRNLYKDDTEILQIQAFDMDGNLFSSIEGLDFQWHIQPELHSSSSIPLPSPDELAQNPQLPTTKIHKNDALEYATNKSTSIISFLPFKNQHIEASETLLKLEASGRQGGAVLIHANYIGRVMVTVQLLSPEFNHVPSTSVYLTVLEPLELEPSIPIFLAPYSSYQYILQTFEKDSIRPVPMPNSQYKWSSDHPEILSISDMGVVTTFGQLGTACVEVKFVPIEDNYARGYVHVTAPAVLMLRLIPLEPDATSDSQVDGRFNDDAFSTTLKPFNVQAFSALMVQHRRYRLQVQVYDYSRHLIHSTDSMKFKVTLDDKFFQFEKKSDNDSWFELLSLKEGITEIRVVLESLGPNKLTTSPSSQLQWESTDVIEFQQEITIFKPISITSNVETIVLPYHQQVKHSYQLEAGGGSQSYIWSSSNNLVATVNNSGLVMINQSGTTHIRCVDDQLSYNSAEIDVVVNNPKLVEFLQGKREVLIGNQLVLPVMLYHDLPLSQSIGSSKPNLTFTKCSALEFEANLQDPKVFSQPEFFSCDLLEETRNIQGACTCARLMAIEEGQTHITISYNYWNLDISKEIITLTTSTPISSFREARIDPPNLLLTYGSRAKFSIVGGPQTWTFQYPIIPQIIPSKPEQVAIESISSSTSGFWHYQLICLAHGYQNIMVVIGNAPSLANPDPVSFQSQLSVSCQPPAFFLLHPLYLPSLMNTAHGEKPYLVPAKHFPSFKYPRDSRPVLGFQGPLTVEVGNTASGACTHHIISSLLTLDQVPTSDLTSAISKYTLRNNQTIAFSLTMFDRSGLKFNSFSSLDIKWESSDPSLLTILDHPNSSADTRNQRRIFKVTNANGTVRVTIKISSFDSSALNNLLQDLFKNLTIKLPNLPLQELTQHFDFSLSSDIRLVPSKLILYYCPDNEARILAQGGSGYNLIISNKNPDLIEATFESGTNEVVLRTLKTGFAKLVATDECLTGSEPVHSFVRVSEVSRIVIQATEVVKLYDEVKIQIHILDEADEDFGVDQFRFMDLRVHLEGEALDFHLNLNENNIFKFVPHNANEDNAEHERKARTTPSSPTRQESQHTHLEYSDTISPSLDSSDIIKIILTSSEITAYAQNVGVSTISVSVINSVSKLMVSSPPIQVHVYPPLQVLPNRLELIPGASFQLEVSGGPPFRHELSFLCTDPIIATVNQEGLVTANPQLGVTNIIVSIHIKADSRYVHARDVHTFNMSQNNTNAKDNVDIAEISPHDDLIVVAQEIITLTVKQFSGIMIFASTQTLLVGEKMIVRVLGQDMESPYIWSGINLQFKWDIMNTDIISLAPLYNTSGGGTLDDELEFSVDVHAIAPGTTRLSAKVISGPSSLLSKSASITLEVIAPLGLFDVTTSTHLFGSENSSSLPSSSLSTCSCSLCKPAQILLAPNSRYSLRPTIPAVYDLIDASRSPLSDNTTIEDLINRLDTKSEQIISSGVVGVSYLRLKESQYQLISLVKVMVKPIHHLELRLRSPAHSELPVGSHFDFDIVLRDQLGQEFDSYDSVQFEWHLNRQDLISVDLLRSKNSEFRQMLRIKGLRPGKVMLMVKAATKGRQIPPSPSHINESGPQANKLPNLQHFQSIHVINAILPQNPIVHLGGTIQFITSFKHDPSYRRTWSANPDTVLSIDPLTGLAKALAPGVATVYHQSSVYTVTAVNVITVNHVEFQKSNCPILSNLKFIPNTHLLPEMQSSCEIPLKFYDNKNALLEDSEFIKHGLNVRCYTPSNHVLDVETLKLDKRTESRSNYPTSLELDGYACVVKVLPEKKSEFSLLDSGVIKVDLVASLSLFKRTFETSITLDPAFFINAPQEIHLFPSKLTTNIEVFSNSSLQVASGDPSHLTVQLIDTRTNAKLYLYQVKVSNSSSPFSRLPVEFSNSETLQTEVLFISFSKTIHSAQGNDKGSEFVFVSNQRSSYWSFSFLIAIGTCIIIGAYVLSVLLGDHSKHIPSTPLPKETSRKLPVNLTPSKYHTPPHIQSTVPLAFRQQRGEYSAPGSIGTPYPFHSLSPTRPT